MEFRKLFFEAKLLTEDNITVIKKCTKPYIPKFLQLFYQFLIMERSEVICCNVESILKDNVELSFKKR